MLKLTWTKGGLGYSSYYSIGEGLKKRSIYLNIIPKAFGSNKYRIKTEPMDGILANHQFYDTLCEAKKAGKEAVERFVEFHTTGKRSW